MVTAPQALPVYLDHNATTPLAPGVLDTMTAYLGQHFGNPSSNHPYGRAAHTAIDTARAQLAALIGASPAEIVFTGSGSEADALAILGTAAGYFGHVITQATEHPAVLATCNQLSAVAGLRVTVLPVDEHGMLDPATLTAAITPDTLLVSVMHANNETGTIQPSAELASITHRAGALFHIDAAQTCGKIDVHVNAIGADLLTVAGHKFGAPKGVGALYVRHGVALTPLHGGGGQEHGLRSGTENVAGIAGLGVAADFVHRTLQEEGERQRRLRDLLHQLLQDRFGARLHLNGHPQHRLPNTLNVSIDGQNGPALLQAAQGIAASTGSACHDGTTSSPVLAAMGLSTPRVAAAIRLSLGRTTTGDDITRAAQLITDAAAAAAGSR